MIEENLQKDEAKELFKYKYIRKDFFDNVRRSYFTWLFIMCFGIIVMGFSLLLERNNMDFAISTYIQSALIFIGIRSVYKSRRFNLLLPITISYFLYILLEFLLLGLPNEFIFNSKQILMVGGYGTLITTLNIWSPYVYFILKIIVGLFYLTTLYYKLGYDNIPLHILKKLEEEEAAKPKGDRERLYV